MKKRSLLFLIGLAAAVSLAIAMALPASHYVIVGILHQESFYNGRPTSYWIDALKHEPFARRSAPAQDIGAYLREGGFEALPVLRQMLHDQDTQVASEARMAISLILRDVDSLRISELLSFAKDRDPQMRQ